MQKNGDISKIKEVFVLKGLFSKTTYVCVITYEISNFYHNSIEFYTEGWGFNSSPTTSKQTHKKSTQIRVNKINLDDNDLEIMIYVKLVAWCNEYKQCKTLINDLSKQLMFVAWHPLTWWDWCLP